MDEYTSKGDMRTSLCLFSRWEGISDCFIAGTRKKKILPALLASRGKRKISPCQLSLKPTGNVAGLIAEKTKIILQILNYLTNRLTVRRHGVWIYLQQFLPGLYRTLTVVHIITQYYSLVES